MDRLVDRSERARAAITDVAYTAFSTGAAAGVGAHAPGLDLMTNVLQAYSDAVGGDAAAIYEHVRDGWTTPWFILPADVWPKMPHTRLPTRQAATIHPGIRHALDAAPTGPFTITDLMPQRVWINSELGRAMKPDWGSSLQLMAPIASKRRSPVCRVWVLCRYSTDFSIGDREVALALQPLLTAVTRHYVKSAERELPADAAGLITEREAAVLRLLLAGNRPMAIANQLGISVRTVDKHLERTYRKFNVHDRHMLAHVLNHEISGNAVVQPS